MLNIVWKVSSSTWKNLILMHVYFLFCFSILYYFYFHIAVSGFKPFLSSSVSIFRLLFLFKNIRITLFPSLNAVIKCECVAHPKRLTWLTPSFTLDLCTLDLCTLLLMSFWSLMSCFCTLATVPAVSDSSECPRCYRLVSWPIIVLWRRPVIRPHSPGCLVDVPSLSGGLIAWSATEKPGKRRVTVQQPTDIRCCDSICLYMIHLTFFSICRPGGSHFIPSTGWSGRCLLDCVVYPSCIIIPYVSVNYSGQLSSVFYWFRTLSLPSLTAGFLVLVQNFLI